MSEPRFVIASTGLCGSGYISQVFRNAGVKVGHEHYWNIHGSRLEGLVGDSSWLAVSHLKHYDGIVYHQIDHPLKVVSRWLHMERDPSFDDAYRRERERVSGIYSTGEDINDVVKIYLAYIREIEQRAEMTWRLEDINVDLLCNVATDAGILLFPEQAHHALAVTPRDHNTRGVHPYLEWSDFPDTLEVDGLQRLCGAFGYDLEI